MNSLVLIKHKDMSSDILRDIIKLKSVAWPYSYEKQSEWINNNIKEEDLHVFLMLNNEKVAYLNLITLELNIDDKKIKCYGIGNVCALEKGKGFGKSLMEQVNSYLKEIGKVGLLFCRKELISFYKNNGWLLIDPIQFESKTIPLGVHKMIFGYTGNFTRINFNGESF